MSQISDVELRDRLPMTDTVRAAIEHAAAWCPADQVLQTGAVLSTVISAYIHGEWNRVWASYTGEADTVPAAARDHCP